MQRILIVLRGPIDAGLVRRRCCLDMAGPYEMAICYVLPEGHDGLRDGLCAQQELTAALRFVMGRQAESIAVLVASDRPSESLEDCIREWNPTLVYA